MVGVLLSAAMILACLFLIQVIRRPKVQRSLLSLDHTDIIKGVSVFLIIVGHIGVLSGFTYLAPLGFSSLAAFLICSGIGLQKSYEKNGLNGFFKKRLIRIMIPYWIAVVFFFVLNPAKFSPVNLIKTLLLIESYDFWWFIQFIAASYILFYLVYRFIPDRFRLPCIGLLAAVFFAFQPDDLLAAQSFSIPVGILISKYGSRMVLSNKRSLIISLVSLALAAVLLAVKRLPMIHTSIYPVYNAFQVVISLLLAMTILGMSYTLMTVFPIRMLAVAGRASYELYITHTLLIFMIANRVTVLNVVLYVAVFGVSAVAFYFLNKQIAKALSGSPRRLPESKIT